MSNRQLNDENPAVNQIDFESRSMQRQIGLKIESLLTLILR